MVKGMRRPQRRRERRILGGDERRRNRAERGKWLYFAGYAAVELPGLVVGGIEPRQEPFSLATGVSSLGQHTVNSPFVRQTCTIISRDWASPFHQNQPGWVGGSGNGSKGGSGCFLSEGGLMSLNGNASCSRVSIRSVCQCRRVTGRRIDSAPSSSS